MLVLPLLFVAVFSIFQSRASSFKLFPGYYIEKAGDTIHCQVDFKDWNRNPATIEVEVNGARRTLSPGDVRGFGVAGYADYESALVTYHLDRIRGADLPDHYSDQLETKEWFLKVLVRGTYSLYELVLRERPYYFVSSPGGAVAELVYRAKIVNSMVQEDIGYQLLLRQLFEQEGIAEKYNGSIIHANYYAGDLIRLINKLNEHRTGKPTAMQAPKGHPLELSVFAGGVFNSFPAQFSSHYAGYHMDPAMTWTGGLDLRYYLPSHFRSFAFGISFGYESYKGSVTKTGSTYTYSSANYQTWSNYQEQVSMNQTQLATGIYALYVINPLSRTRMYVKAGVNDNFSIGGKGGVYSTGKDSTWGFRNGVVPINNMTYFSGVPLISFAAQYYRFNATFGMEFGRNKLEFSAYSGAALSEPGGTKFKVNTFGLNYFFTFLR